MKYGIQSMDSGCDYTTLDSLEDCKKWVSSNKFELEQNNARYIQIVNADNSDEMIFYANVEWNNGASNISEIAEEIGRKAI